MATLFVLSRRQARAHWLTPRFTLNPLLSGGSCQELIPHVNSFEANSWINVGICYIRDEIGDQRHYGDNHYYCLNHGKIELSS